MIRCVTGRLLQQQKAEHQREQSHRFDDADNDEVVGGTLSGLAQRVGGSGGNLALEEGGRPMARPAKMPVNLASAASQPPSTALRMKFISKKP